MAKGVKTGGRQKGTPNKVTRVFKDAMLLCYRRIGGDKAFAEWARANRTEFYKIMSKLLPAEINLAAHHQVELTYDPEDDFETAKRVAFILAQAKLEQPHLADALVVDALPQPLGATEAVLVDSLDAVLSQSLPTEPVPAEHPEPVPAEVPVDPYPHTEGTPVDNTFHRGCDEEQGRTTRRMLLRPVIRRRS